ncbi:hypothetical protein J8273_3188 [Carpediemonas membranifera]|uniref:Uncharacterized protein n=1 Tax=Carpediemonas membranifera TaxID=201153 RepID=A0A8J6B4V8_9EUKA|nr:hypothetical protein J8273_3188 [Carpediemonas membranifera]|eukprot:KAG9393059.1 hypothetical protein J8273_3188 [Carpediemonas membranifera]
MTKKAVRKRRQKPNRRKRICFKKGGIEDCLIAFIGLKRVELLTIIHGDAESTKHKKLDGHWEEMEESLRPIFKNRDRIKISWTKLRAKTSEAELAALGARGEAIYEEIMGDDPSSDILIPSSDDLQAHTPSLARRGAGIVYELTLTGGVYTEFIERAKNAIRSFRKYNYSGRALQNEMARMTAAALRARSLREHPSPDEAPAALDLPPPA